jgi:hypothetical protein
MAQGKPTYAFFKGAIVPLEEAKVSVLSAIRLAASDEPGLHAFPTA